MKRHHLAALVVSLSVLGLAAVAPRVRAGACGSFGTVALELVPPGGEIPVDPEAGPLLRQVVGRGRAPVSGLGLGGSRALFEHVSVRGPRGVVAVDEREIAPGLHRLTGAFRPGVHRIRGVEGDASVTFAASHPSPLEPPALAGAAHRTTTSGLGAGIGSSRGRPRPSESVEVTLSQPPPRGAWMLLLYAGGGDPARGRAINAIEIAERGTSYTFHRGNSSRCGPNLPLGGVPAAGGPVTVAWLTRTGRLSPASTVVNADAAH